MSADGEAETSLPARFAFAETKEKFSHEPPGWFEWLHFNRPLTHLSITENLHFCVPQLTSLNFRSLFVT